VFATFESRAREANAEVHRVPTRAEALALVEERLKAEGVADRPSCYAVWAPSPLLAGIDQEALIKRIPGLHFDVSVDLATQSLVGISQFDWAVADTGSLAQEASGIAQCLVSTLPPTHIALVSADSLVPDLATLLTVARPDTATCISLITGPSRTADIERVLTIGVHGPAQLIIIVVDDLAVGDE
jgi:L-lactate dehydrogenase complex protein LldG